MRQQCRTSLCKAEKIKWMVQYLYYESTTREIRKNLRKIDRIGESALGPEPSNFWYADCFMSKQSQDAVELITNIFISSDFLIELRTKDTNNIVYNVKS